MRETSANKISLRVSDLGREHAVQSSSSYFLHESQMAPAAAGRLQLEPMTAHSFPMVNTGSAFSLPQGRQEHGVCRVVLAP